MKRYKLFNLIMDMKTKWRSSWLIEVDRHASFSSYMAVRKPHPNAHLVTDHYIRHIFMTNSIAPFAGPGTMRWRFMVIIHKCRQWLTKLICHAGGSYPATPRTRIETWTTHLRISRLGLNHTLSNLYPTTLGHAKMKALRKMDETDVIAQQSSRRPWPKADSALNCLTTIVYGSEVG